MQPSTNKTFNADIQSGDFIIAKHHSWKEARRGIIVSRTSETLVAFHTMKPTPSLGHFTVKIAEIEAGEWEIQIGRELAINEVKT